MAAKEPFDLHAKLKKADPIVRDYIAELTLRNAKLQHQMVKLEADKVERDGKIEALKKEIKKGKPPVFKVEVVGVAPQPDTGLVGYASDLLKQIKPKEAK